MAEVLVLVEQDAEGALKKVTNELITAARALGTPVSYTHLTLPTIYSV